MKKSSSKMSRRKSQKKLKQKSSKSGKNRRNLKSTLKVRTKRTNNHKRSQKNMKYVQRGGFSVPFYNEAVNAMRMIPYTATSSYHAYNPPPSKVDINPTPFKDQYMQKILKKYNG